MRLNPFSKATCLCLCVLSALVGCSKPTDKQSGVVLLRYAVGSASTDDRERGFLDTMQKEFPDIKVISEETYAGATASEALDKSAPLLARLEGRITGVFAVNESAALGMHQAMAQRKLTGKVPFVGFDSSDALIKGMEEGTVDGIVLQNPVRMGYLSVKTIVAHLEGEKVEKVISTGEEVATPENMKEKKIDELLNPPRFDDATASKPADVKYKIGMIPKGHTHSFWKSVRYGADQAAGELGNVELIWEGPLKEDQRESQVSKVQDFIGRKVNGICLAPLDAEALVDVVKQAKDKGIPVLIFDSALSKPELTVSYVATDNYNGGVLGAKRLAAAIKAKAQSAKAQSAK